MNRSETLGAPSVGSHARTRLTVAVLAALALAVAVMPGVRARLSSSLPRTPDEASLPGAHFSDPPTDDEFLRAGLFVQPLVPVGPSSPEENKQLGALLVAYSRSLVHGDSDAVQPLADFVSQHPHSVWTPGLELELGAVYRRTGHFSKALATWQSGWDASKNLQSADGRIVGDMTAAYLSQFEAYLGRKEVLAPLLEDLKARPVRGSAAELISESARGLAEMLSRPDASFRCGPVALTRILKQSPTPDASASRRVLNAAESTPNGLSLTAVQAISVEARMNYQMAYRSPGSPVVIPAVAHWKVGHYAAILGRDARERLFVGDATFGEDITIAQTTFDEETSGYFLLPPGPLPQGWRQVSADEGGTVWGRGNTGKNHDDTATGRDEVQAFECKHSRSFGGCTNWNVEAAVVGLELRDDPIGYKPPVGPEIRFPMTYSHRDTRLPMAPMYTSFGNKWTFGWLSYVVDQADPPPNFGSVIYGVGGAAGGITFTGAPADSVLSAGLYRRGGGQELYSYPSIPTASIPTATTQKSAEGQLSQAYLTRTVDPLTHNISFTRALPDGSIEKFTLLLGTNGAPGAIYFMTEVDDPQGNPTKIIYDSATHRITNIVDAAGQPTHICYNDSLTPCTPPAASVNPPNKYDVTEIVDNFGRFAKFGYDPVSGHLTSITDVLGIVSSYQYDTAATGESVDFINQLTTPYGITNFTYSDSTTLAATDPTRTLQITETSLLGNSSAPPRVSYVKYFQGSTSPCTTATTVPSSPTFPVGSTFDVNEIECSDGNITHSPQPVDNSLLNFRNTFIWNPKQYSHVNQPDQYQAAKIIHWLHTDDNAGQTSLTAARIPESIKEPLENRVWYLYPGQVANAFPGIQSSISVGATNQPTTIMQAVGDGTFKTWQFIYDNYGHVKESFDPMGRTLLMTYDPTNNIDLLTVTNNTPAATTSPAHNDRLLTLSNYFLHKPRHVTGADGQTTTLAYNASGQITSSTDPLNNTWTYNYIPSAGGFLTGIVGPSVTVLVPTGGKTTQIPSYTFTYDNVGRLWTAEGPDFQMLTFSYDSADRLTTTVFPDHTTEVRSYTLSGAPMLDLQSFTDRMGYVTGRQYDGFRELIEIDEPSARATKMTYWPDGTVEAITDPLKNVTTYLQDLQGRAQKVTYADNTTQWYAYDNLGRVTSVSPDQAATYAGTIKYAYNLDDTISTAFLDARAPTNFTYDPAYMRLTGWFREKGATWAEPKTPCANCGLLDAETYEYIGVGTYGANKVQSVLTRLAQANPLNQTNATIIYGYDQLGRVASTQVFTTPTVLPNYPGGSAVAATETFSYDAIGRLTNDANLLNSFKYTYNDATARIGGRTSAGGPQISASYLPPQQDGLLQQLTYAMPAGATPGATLAQYTYGYDVRHNVTAAGNTSYSYDAYGQLAAAQLPPVGTRVPEFNQAIDLSGNITATATTTPSAIIRIPPVPAASTFVDFLYDSANKMTQKSTGGTGLSTLVQPVFSDNGVGSLWDVGTNSNLPLNDEFDYDASNHLSSHEHASSPEEPSWGGPFTETFLYDGLGRLSEVQDGGYMGSIYVVISDRSYAWCGQKMCLEFDNWQAESAGAGGAVASLPDALYVAQGTVSDPTGPTAATTSAQRSYDITDMLGSERAVFSNNAIVAQYQYDTFGNRSTVMGSPTASNRGFTGFYYNAGSGLQFARNRVYDASLGRWLTRDPIGIDHAFDDPERFNATDLNLYAYAGNNPQSMVDPSGNNPIALAPWFVGGGELAGGAVALPFAAIAAGGLAIKAGIDAWFAYQAYQQGIIDYPGNNPPYQGDPGSTVRGGVKSRRYGPDGYPETDRHLPHPDERAPGNEDHSHDWGRDPGGGCSDKNKGPPRAPVPGDPPVPRGPNK